MFILAAFLKPTSTFEFARVIGYALYWHFHEFINIRKLLVFDEEPQCFNICKHDTTGWF